MQVPLSFQDQTVLEELPQTGWRRLFDAVGWPESLKPKRDSFSPPDIRAAFETDALSDELLLGIDALQSLGNDAGRDAVTMAMADQRIPPESLPPNLGARELALEVFLRRSDDAAWSDVFFRAHAETEVRGGHRRYNDFLAREPRPVAGLRNKAKDLKAAVLEYLLAHDLGDHVHAHAFDDGGTAVIQIVRSHAISKPRAVLPGRSGRTTIEFRPVYADMVQYDASIGRLRIAARFASFVEFYRRTLGKILFDDEDFFSNSAVYDLNVLRGGQAVLERHDMPAVGRVRMTECIWQRADRETLHLRSNDCFQAIQEIGLPMIEGEIIQVGLKMQVAERSTRPVIIVIRAGRVEVNQKRHEVLVDDFLRAIGIRGQQPVGASNLWNLFPWRHPASVWHSAFGTDTDTLVERAVLRPVKLQSVGSPGQRGAGGALDVVAIGANSYYGVSDEPEIRSRSLSSTDLDGFEFQPERFREYLNHYLGVSPSDRAWIDESVLDLGEVTVGDLRVRLAHAVRQPQPGIGERLRSRFGASPFVLLLPIHDSEILEIATAPVALPLRTPRQIIRDIIIGAGLSNDAPAIYRARDGASLIVDSRKQQVWVHDVLISGLHPDTGAFKFVEEMAKARSQPVTQETLTRAISGHRMHTDGTVAARKAKSDASKIIAADLASGGRPLDTPLFVSAGTGCYRCTLPAEVI